MAKTYSNGSYVGIETAICPICCKTHTPSDAAVLLHKRMCNVFPPSGKAEPSSNKLCEEHLKLYEDNFVALIGCDPEKSQVNDGGKVSKLGDEYRTGLVMHIRSETLLDIVDTDIYGEDGELLPFMFCDDEVIRKLAQIAGQDIPEDEEVLVDG